MSNTDTETQAPPPTPPQPPQIPQPQPQQPQPPPAQTLPGRLQGFTQPLQRLAALNQPPTPPTPPTAPGGGIPAQPAPPSTQTHPLAINRYKAFQRFVPNQGGKPPSQWGKPHWPILAAATNPNIFNTPFMPSDQEAIELLRARMSQLARDSAPAVGQPANVAAQLASIVGPFFDYFSNNAFSTNYRNRRLGGLQEQEMQRRLRQDEMIMKRQQMIDSTDEAIANHKRILAQYGEVFSLMEVSPETGKAAITEDQARRRIQQLNAENNWHVLDLVLQNQGFSGVQKRLEEENNKFLDAMSGVTALKESDKAKKKADGDESDSWLEGGGGKKGAGGEVGPGGVLGPRYEGHPAARGPGATPETLPERGAMDDELAKTGLSPDGIRAAHRYAIDGPDPQLNNKHNKLAAQLIENGGEKLRAAIGDIAHTADDPDKKLEEIAKYDKDIANEVKSLMDLRTNPAGLGKERKHLINLASATSNGKYNEAMYDVAKKMRDPDSESGKQQTRVIMLGQTALGVEKALADLRKTIGPNFSIPRRQFELMMDSVWRGDSRFTNLYHALSPFAIEVSGVASGTGTARQGIMNYLLKHMTAGASEEQIRGAEVAEMQGGYAYIRQINDYWQRETGSKTNAPLLRGPGVDIYDALIHQNIKTGEKPEGSPIEVMSTSMKPTPKTKPEDAVPPLSFKDRKAMRDFVMENRDNPDPVYQATVQDFIQKLGINP